MYLCDRLHSTACATSTDLTLGMAYIDDEHEHNHNSTEQPVTGMRRTTPGSSRRTLEIATRIVDARTLRQEKRLANR